MGCCQSEQKVKPYSPQIGAKEKDIIDYFFQQSNYYVLLEMLKQDKAPADVKLYLCWKFRNEYVETIEDTDNSSTQIAFLKSEMDAFYYNELTCQYSILLPLLAFPPLTRRTGSAVINALISTSSNEQLVEFLSQFSNEITERNKMKILNRLFKSVNTDEASDKLIREACVKYVANEYDRLLLVLIQKSLTN
jgi:hypothetical protein